MMRNRLMLAAGALALALTATNARASLVIGCRLGVLHHVRHALPGDLGPCPSSGLFMPARLAEVRKVGGRTKERRRESAAFTANRTAVRLLDELPARRRSSGGSSRRAPHAAPGSWPQVAKFVDGTTPNRILRPLRSQGPCQVGISIHQRKHGAAGAVRPQ